MYQKSLIILKPDALQRRLVGRIIQRFEDTGLKIHAMKFTKMSKEKSRQHYAEHIDKPFYKSLEKYVTSNPIIIFILGGNYAIDKIRLMVGDTMPGKALPGTIRGDFAHQQRTGIVKDETQQPLMNLIHASATVDEAKNEIDIWFAPDESNDYSAVDDAFHGL